MIFTFTFTRVTKTNFSAAINIISNNKQNKLRQQSLKTPGRQS